AGTTPVPSAFVRALRSVPMGLIAEVKHRSPSAGVIREPFVPSDIARSYERAGAQAVSVLMDEPYFGGGEAHFREVREAVEMPMLYKEFVVEAWQVWHARALGASAVLLIAAALEDDELQRLMRVAAEARLDVLLEVHDADELDRALGLDARLIGINNRNLKTFETRLEHTLDLMPKVPESVTLISESGIRGPEDVARLRAGGVSGVLVGEHLLRQSNLESAVRELMGT
ncbi:MAG: indole-3-glycerol phosphate synthase TrpC, partial [Kiritimatiellae bacterium]|nr:indole-3-glycerol phosphate synthase TrpC [Kiritimatiellia bacterium]